MAKISFQLQSQTELRLTVPAQAGDVIDLTDQQNMDTSVLSDTLTKTLDDRIAQQQKEWQAATDQQLADAKATLTQQFTAEKATLASEAERQKEQALNDQRAEIQALQAQLKTVTDQQTAAIEQAVLAKTVAYQNQSHEQSTAHQAALTALEKKITELQHQLASGDQEKALALAEVRANYDAQLKAAAEQVEFYKDFKARQSTKEIGESLEQYAHTEFNKVRAMAFPNAYFEKDNAVSRESGSKGDFIFRDYVDGLEYISIMFDMKNEADTTATKHKNSDFFKELDKDRREKKTEYAVLVSLLEADNDLYNTGIVEVHDFEKMYVVRPQFFIQLIGILRNAAQNSLGYQRELAEMREQNIDITNFESKLETFKTGFSKNYQSASTNFQKAIESIDKSIARMEDVKRALTTSENQLRLANNKLDDVSVKKLTRGNPTMKQKFADLDA